MGFRKLVKCDIHSCDMSEPTQKMPEKTVLVRFLVYVEFHTIEGAEHIAKPGDEIELPERSAKYFLEVKKAEVV